MQIPTLDRLSFWIGFLAGALFMWVAGRLWAFMPELRQILAEQIKAARESLSVGTEERYRQDVISLVQRLHLASSFFSLDEIYIPAGVLPPPAAVEPESELPDEDVFTLSLPYLPDWPELAAAYRAPTLDLLKVLQGGTNVLLLGNPGSGKTVALAHLATLLARQDPECGELRDDVPFYFHALDLNLSSPAPEDIAQPLIDALASHVSTLTLARLPNMVHAVLENQKACLLVDGLDELPHETVRKVAEYLHALLKKYPGQRLIAASAPEFYDGLARLGLAPVAMALWNDRQRADFIHRWNELWTQHIAPPVVEGAESVDPFFVESWLANSDTTFTPLETTLKVWSAFAGDVLGSQPTEAIEAYLLRMTIGIPRARPILERIAVEMAYQMVPTIAKNEIEKWLPEIEAASVASFEETGLALSVEPEPPVEPVPEAEGENPAPESPAERAKDKDGDKKASTEPKGSMKSLADLIANGVLVQRRDGGLGFFHPTVAGYLAGAALAAQGSSEPLVNQPSWTGKLQAIRYMAARCDIGASVAPLIEHQDDPLQRPILMVARWLRDSAKDTRWRAVTLRKLASLLQQPVMPPGLRARLATALAYSGDSGVAVLFRQMLNVQSPNVRQVAALGCGLLRDTKAVNDLMNLLSDPQVAVSRAALLALSLIGTKPCLEALASILLQGSEELRRATAEILATDPVEGHEMLREGSTMDDLLVRRAVVFGLVSAGEPWAVELIQKMQIEDAQWVVRSAATQAAERLQKPDVRIPRPLPDLASLPWLIMFASRQGLGVTAGKQAREMLMNALRTGTEEERLAALHYLLRRSDENAIPQLYQMYYSNDDTQEATYITLWHMAAAGVELPHPHQYGVG